MVKTKRGSTIISIIPLRGLGDDPKAWPIKTSSQTLRNQLKQNEAHVAFMEQQHAHQLKQKSLGIQIADLKIQQHEEKLREHLKKQHEKTKNQKEKLESLCKSLKAERKQNLNGQSNPDSVHAV
ncbi:hypothetical protein Tco_1493595 [Tanacetum coccineum]